MGEGSDRVSCEHSIQVKQPDFRCEFTGEMEAGQWYPESTYVNVATGVDRCKICGHLQYYTGAWRRYYEENVQCFGGKAEEYDLIQSYRAKGYEVGERDGRLQPVLTKIGSVSGHRSFFFGLFASMRREGCAFVTQDLMFKVRRRYNDPAFFILPTEDAPINTWTVYVPRSMDPSQILTIREKVFKGILIN